MMTKRKLMYDRGWLVLIGLITFWISVMVLFDPAAVSPGSTYAVPPPTGIVNQAAVPPTPAPPGSEQKYMSR